MIPINDLSRGFRLFQEEYEAKALEILRSGRYILGREVEAFEAEFAASLSPDCFCAGVDNGLDAIHLGLLAAGIGPGDEVIMQANGYIATAQGILHCGATPVFVEPDEYYQLDASQIERVLTKKTKAVLVTHLYGQATRMGPIVEICRRHHLRLFEDCAQAHFAACNGICAGLFGDASFFSFYPTKLLGGFGDGGAVVTKDREIAQRVKTLRNYGSDRRYHNTVIGFNARLDEMQAGFLRVKLSHIEAIAENRRQIARQYLDGIRNPRVRLPETAEGCTHVWYQFVMRTDDRQAFRAHLHACGVATDVAWETPPYLQPCMTEKFGFKRGDFPRTEEICDTVVSLPMMDRMSEQEIRTVIDAVNSFA